MSTLIFAWPRHVLLHRPDWQTLYYIIIIIITILYAGSESGWPACGQVTRFTASGPTERRTRRRADVVVERLSRPADDQGQGQHSRRPHSRRRARQRTRGTLAHPPTHSRCDQFTGGAKKNNMKILI